MELEERIAVCEANDKNIFHQLDELKTEVRDMHDLAASVKVIATKTDEINTKVDGIGNRLEKVERVPAEDYRHYKRLIYGCIITGIVGAIIGSIFALILK